jgi:hypothetical protein
MLVFWIRAWITFLPAHAMKIVTPFTPLTLKKDGPLETQWVAVFRFNTVNADVVYYQTQPIFPSWMSLPEAPRGFNFADFCYFSIQTHPKSICFELEATVG